MSSTMENIKPFVISRVFDAPREWIWKAWTDQKHMQWWGPGVAIGHAKLDLRPGGTFHYSMATPDGKEMWGRWILREIKPMERLVFVNSFSDKAGGVTRHPMSAHWPLEMLTTTTFEEQNGKTTLTIQWEPVNATEIELKTFDDGRESMKNGWNGSLDRLTEQVAAQKASITK